MKKLRNFPGWVAVIALVVCLAPSSFGLTAKATGTTTRFASLPATATLTAVTSLYEPLESDRRKKKDRGGNTNMPEGGSALVYLGLAGLVCMGAVALAYRRKKLASGTIA
jgi:hypothetical protein